MGAARAGPAGAPQPLGVHRSVPNRHPAQSEARDDLTSHVERNNLTMRTFLRRMTPLCLGFSKKLKYLKHAVALHFAHYNFCRIHKTLCVTPAIEAGITDHMWTLQEPLAA